MPSEEYIRNEYIQEGGLRAVLRRIDAEYLIDLDCEVQSWYKNVLETTKCQKIDEVSEKKFNKSSTVEKQHEIVRDLRAAND